MIVRHATVDDTPALIEMARQFLESTVYGRLFKATPESLEALVRLVFNFGDNAAILLAVDETGPVGMIVSIAGPHPVTGQIFADEVVWWVNPTARGQQRVGPKLLRSAEDWARAKRCSMVKMVAPYGSTVGEFYERLGYTAVETAYAKPLGGD